MSELNNSATEPARVTIQQPTLPQGGGAIRGIGDSFQPDFFSGTAGYSIPIGLTSARGLEPKLALNYNSGAGNSEFGLGFSLTLPKITVNTDQGIPRYQGNDKYILSGIGELVKISGDKNPRNQTEAGIDYIVTSYLPRLDDTFSVIEQWMNKENGISFWKILATDNSVSYYGQSTASRIADPDHEYRTFEWLIDGITDAKGNKMTYAYKIENEDNVPVVLSEVNRSYSANRYIQHIKYGNYIDEQQKEQFAFEVLFDYGEYSLDNLATVYTPKQTWTYRKDPFSSYRSGFEIRTCRACQHILLFHHFKELGGPCLVRSMTLSHQSLQQYDVIDIQGMSLLHKVEIKGYRKQEDSSIEQQDLPAIELQYSQFNPPSSPQFKKLSLPEHSLPGYIEGTQFLSVDLDGDGLPGFLYSNSQSNLYFAPLGHGKYAAPENRTQFPVEKNLQEGQASLVDIDGNGMLELLINHPNRSGYYQNTDAGNWKNFISFPDYPNDLANIFLESTDLNANGKTDLLLADTQNSLVYTSKGTKGYSPAQQVLNRHDFPVKKETDLTELITFANIFGDGLSHRLKVGNGSVECWPCLGYGNYGKKITLGNAPLFGEGFDSSRVFLADINGSGTTDLIYIYPDYAAIFLNQNGNSFSAPILITLPGIYSKIDQISFSDILGNGTSCLVFTVIEPVPIHYYYNFSGELILNGISQEVLKPYLLNRIDNHMGSIIQIRYCSSTKFALEDRLAGHPWITKLRFPVQVVEETITTDLPSDSRYVSRYKYHDGYYDPVERVFRGFGFVESWDTDIQGPELQNEGQFLPPVYTKTWYQTGASHENQAITLYQQKGYFQGDKKAYDFPDNSFLIPASDNDPETWRQAYVTLKGKLIRKEVYAEDNRPESINPYTVEQSNYEIILKQGRLETAYAIFTVNPQQQISYRYERNPNDPLVQQDFVLETDPLCGKVKKACTVFLPRRRNDQSQQEIYPEQLSLKATVQHNNYINTLDTEPFRWRGLSAEEQQFEVFGLDLATQSYFSFTEIQTQINTAFQKIVPYEGTVNAGELQLRQQNWNRTYYWNEQQTNPAPLLTTGSRALVHHQEQAVFPRAFASELFKEQLNETRIETEGGYYPDPLNGYWWNRGSIQHYFLPSNPEAFFMPDITENGFVEQSSLLYQKTVLTYKTPYYLLPISVQQYLDESVINEETYEIDYQAQQYRQITDINNNVKQMLFDPIGQIIVSTLFKEKDGVKTGGMSLYPYHNQPAQYIPRSKSSSGDPVSFEDVLANSAYYLQGAAQYIFYRSAYQTSNKLPIAAINLIRINDYENTGIITPFSCETQISFSDGLGRIIEKKQAFQQDLEPRWLVSGRTVYNNKGKPFEEYLSYFSDNPNYELQQNIEAAQHIPPTQTFYDPLLRVIRINSPKGFFSKIEFSSWEEKYYDEDDTVLDSVYYQTNYPDKLSPDEKDALDKAAIFFNTPTIKITDNTGSVFLSVQTLADHVQLPTYYETDIEGRPVTEIDPRLYQSNISKSTSYYNFRYKYPMGDKTPLYTDSADAGIRRNLKNIFGNTFWSQSPRNYFQLISYDRLQRKTSLLVKKIENDMPVLPFEDYNLVEVFNYGESQADAANLNLRGQLYQLKDLSGVMINSSYNIRGLLIQTSRQMVTDYKNAINWKQPVELQEDVYRMHYTFDATAHLLQEISPDGSVTTNTYNQGGLLQGISFKDRNEKVQDIISSIQYDAALQRTKVVCGNGINTFYSYEDTTWRLLQLTSSRANPPSLKSKALSPLVQDLSYTYDPVGNITRLWDRTVETVFNNNQQVDPLSGYTYDAIYRLIKANGRQHPGINANTFKNNVIDKSFKQSIFSPLPSVNDSDKLENYQELYTYDQSGNLIRKQHLATSTSYTTETPVEENSNRLKDLEYDSSGNQRQLHINNAVSLTYNCCENLIKCAVIERPEEEDDSDYYLYDSEELRSLKVTERMANGGTITNISEKTYFHNYEIKRNKTKNALGLSTTTLERQTLRIMDDGKCIAIIHYWVKDDNKSEVKAAGEQSVRFQMENHLDSISMEMDAAGLLISYEEYFPYGGTAIIAGKNQQEVQLKDYRYSGKECDDSTGLYYYGARYYISWLGRWTKPDPAGTVDGLNLYAFVGNNPITNTDQNGLSLAATNDQPRTRLFLGESDFSYALAFANKHPELASSMTATTYESESDLQDMDFYTTMSANKFELLMLGVEVAHSVDATDFSSWPDATQIEHIYFSHPHTQSRKTGEHTSNVLKGLFQESTKVLPKNAKIHIARVWKRDGGTVESGIESMYGFTKVLDKDKDVKGTWELIGKHKFSSERYPGYKHTMTKGGGTAGVTKHGSAEFVFRTRKTSRKVRPYSKRKLSIDTDSDSDNETEVKPTPVDLSWEAFKKNFYANSFPQK
ncbi:Rossmann-like fold-containing protein [Pedobacter cryoconitis]|uniref:RHS repeat-associated protein n=1 Tax=Pedobacter cryoconitis TaxID=188932 RepID=A0A7X0MGZ0_9SPHI|nr:Rossmann-like fold-containing protein [Pedobacter cryoconitis]MBB6498857.1 RHS repeat-associated protein [Pedobacter cryoconitis]